MPQKPVKRGYKVWDRANESGFISEFEKYTGKVENNAEKMLGKRVVMDLPNLFVEHLPNFSLTIISLHYL